ncbi:AMP-binding protein [Roseateles sp. NT4]|uniref:AMP-binding protein n=1 Tax=Roseateles sp. NT4 TaxID=3453715 RepID=UPI003F71D5EE
MSMPAFHSIPEAVQAWAERDADKVFARIRKRGSEERAITYTELLDQARQYCGAYQALGVRPGANVFILLNLGEDLIHSFIGAMLGGYIPSYVAPLGDKQDPAHYWKALVHQCQRIEGGVLVTSPENAAQVAALVDQSRAKVLSTDVLHRHFTPATPPLPDTEAIALLQHSSGTTGGHKGVALSHRAILDQIARYAQSLRLDAKDVIVSWLPLYHDMGLISSFLTPLVTGTPLVLLDPFEWVAAPWTLLAAITEHRGTLCWLPNFAFHFLSRAPQPAGMEIDLSSVKAFINCSEPCKPEAFEAFEKRFAAHGVKAGQLQVCYAMAETVFAVTQTTPGEVLQPLRVSRAGLQQGRLEPSDDPLDERVMPVGPPLHGARVRILGDDGQPLPEGRVGEIAICTPYMFSGYYREPELTAAALKGEDYLSGDLGAMHQGVLYITGRKKDLIIVNGKNYYAHDVEEVASDVAGVKAGRVVALAVPNAAMGSESVHVIAESERPEEDYARIARDIKIAIQQVTGLLIAKAIVVPPKWLIKTTSGKMSRWGNREKYLNENKP